jgi:hypothetical protein
VWHHRWCCPHAASIELPSRFRSFSVELLAPSASESAAAPSSQTKLMPSSELRHASERPRPSCKHQAVQLRPGVWHHRWLSTRSVDRAALEVEIFQCRVVNSERLRERLRTLIANKADAELRAPSWLRAPSAELQTPSFSLMRGVWHHRWCCPHTGHGGSTFPSQVAWVPVKSDKSAQTER